MNKKIIITGGTGLLGSKLGIKLSREGNEITLLTRNTSQAREELIWAKHIKEWDYTKPEQWKNIIDGKDAVVHLAGANLSAKRWSDNYKKIIYESRINSTRNIVNVIKSCEVRPKVLITVSAVGIYGNRNDELLNENSKPGIDFLANLCKDWEEEAEKVENYHVRRVTLRLGIVLSREGGMLKKLLPSFKLFVGGSIGTGNQWIPWIHIKDATDIVDFVIKNDSVSGVFNCGAPGIVRMKDFTETLGRIINRPAYFRIPKFVLRMVLGEIADTIVSSQRISIEKLLGTGYNFKFGELESALKNLLIAKD